MVIIRNDMEVWRRMAIEVHSMYYELRWTWVCAAETAILCFGIRVGDSAWHFPGAGFCCFLVLGKNSQNAMAIIGVLCEFLLNPVLGKFSQKWLIQNYALSTTFSSEGKRARRRVMWQNNEKPRSPDGKLNIAARPVAGEDIFGMLAELNEQCLALLAEQAVRPVPPVPPMFRELAGLWSQLDPASRRRAAACPYLLMDAGFCDPYRWQWLSDQHASARAGVADTLQAPLIFGRCFTAPSLPQVARSVFTGSRHIAQTQPLEATLFLGMPAHCVALLRTCSLLQLTALAEHHAGWLRPRWPGRPKVWRQLLEAGISGDAAALELARLHGVQLLAMELKALERLKGLGLAR